MVKYSVGFAFALKLDRSLKIIYDDRSVTRKNRGTVGHLGQQTKPFGFKQLPVPRLSQTVPDWDKSRYELSFRA